MTFKQILQNFILPLLALAALLNFYKGFSWFKLIEGLRRCKLHWIVLATCVHLLNHFLRAYRWRLLIMLKKGIHLGNLPCVLAEMTGFFSNVFVPRLGEWTRCSTLKSMTNIPIKDLLPTVIVERTIDIFVFITTFLSACMVSFLLKEKMSQSLFSGFFYQIASSSLFSTINLCKLLGTLILLAVGSYCLYKSFSKQFQYFSVFCTTLLYSTRSTLFNIKAVTWVVTFFIWLSYFLVEYISCFALGATSQLSFFSIFCLFIVINLGMAIPVPASIGAYHVLMSFALSIFKVDHDSAVVYVTVTHGIQIFNALVVGGLCTIASQFIVRRSSGRSRPVRGG